MDLVAGGVLYLGMGSWLSLDPCATITPYPDVANLLPKDYATVSIWMAGFIYSVVNVDLWFILAVKNWIYLVAPYYIALVFRLVSNR